VVHGEGRSAQAVPPLLGESELRLAGNARRLRARTLRRQRPLSARRSILSVGQQAARWSRQDDVRRQAARMAEACARLLVSADQAGGERLAIVESRQPLRAMES